MGAEADPGQGLQLPILELSKECLVPKQGRSEEWRAMSTKVREACESHGCFLLLVQEEMLPMRLREDMVTAMKELFGLPEETKLRHTSPRAYQSYQGKCPIIPLNESFGIDNACQPDAAVSFTNLMWPQGNSSFCETMKSMSAKMMELIFIILEMLLDSFGVGKHYTSHVENTTGVMRFMKYNIPPSNGSDSSSAAVGLLPHTDKSTLTVLCQNEVQGLEILTKEGRWVQVPVPERTVVVLVGDALKAWSNGRLHAVTHRVMMSQGIKEERYSFAVFGWPKDEFIIEVPNELIDREHPLLYRPFNFFEYFTYFTANIRDDALEVYAGV
ncbi:probable 2-oxoglutarate-dependent dioxygenase AOP1 [Argentina anserina]|uniref:probable 2-oxoglutarate-dependent dioxygenase AOP1 n=1 Tax=Argentina anserina TaxID=57926 RepID=UPI0021768659|nr:probable 2-oxoglutarate-dependent dioxygenase AOP1 [Potentilla anserina]